MCTGAELMGFGSIITGAGKGASAFSLANNYEDRAKDILASSLDSMRQGAKGRERARGRLRAAYAKSGVTMTGTAKTLTQEQIRQDELELLKEKYNAQLEVTSAYEKADEARKGGIMSMVTGGITGGKELSK